MTFTEGALLLLAGLAAGGLNSIAGGGSFISFPMLLLFGVPALNANATSTIRLSCANQEFSGTKNQRERGAQRSQGPGWH